MPEPEKKVDGFLEVVVREVSADLGRLGKEFANLWKQISPFNWFRGGNSADREVMRRIHRYSDGGMVTTTETIAHSRREATEAEIDRTLSDGMEQLDRAVENMSRSLDRDLTSLLRRGHASGGDADENLTIERLQLLYGARIPQEVNNRRLTTAQRMELIEEATETARRHHITGPELESHVMRTAQRIDRQAREAAMAQRAGVGPTETGRVQTATVNKSNKPKAKRKPAQVLAKGRVHSITRWKTNRSKK